MDADSVAFLGAALDDAVSKVRGSLPSRNVTGRGSEAVTLCHAILDGAKSEGDSASAAATSASPLALAALGRKLLRLRYDIHNLYVEIAPYVADVGRQDLPVGLVAVIDNLIAAMLPGGADPIVHHDPNYNYETVWLVGLVGAALTSLRVNYSPTMPPVAFVVPSMEGDNALLLPILAHEVGHVATAEHDLHAAWTAIPEVGAELDRILDECIAKDPDADRDQWALHLYRWVEELICDTASVLLCGPSAMLSAATFLPAPARHDLSAHPFPGDRIRISLEQLRELGWEGILSEHLASVSEWLEELGTKAAREPYTEPLEEFLRLGVAVVTPHLIPIVRPAVSNELIPAEFLEKHKAMDALIEVGIPPAQLPRWEPSPWHLLLAAWLNAVHRYGDAPKALALAVGDRDFNRFTLKAIEMAHLTALWSSV